MEEKIYTIPLRKEFSKVPRYKRTSKAVKAVKKYLQKHLKEEFKIGEYLNKKLWQHGKKNPPSKIKIKVTKKDKIFYAEYINAPEKKEEEKKPKKSSLKERLKARKEPEKKETKKEEKPKEIKKEEKKIEVKKETPKKEIKKKTTKK